MPKQTRNDTEKKKTATKGKKTPVKAQKQAVAKPPAEAENAAEKGKRGAKSQYANKVLTYLADIERYARALVTEGDICKFYGVGKTQWAQYKKDYPELTETLLRAREAGKTDLLDNAYRVAIGYYYEETHTTTVIIDGKPHTKTYVDRKYAKPDAGMIQFLLINRFSGEFARDPQAIELRKKALELAKEGKLPDGWEGI